MMPRHHAVEIRDLVSDSAHVPGVLPWEFFRRLRLRAAGQAELRLAAAVLEDAARCLERERNGSFPDRMLRWEAEQWIRSTDAGPLFSFERICSLLKVDAGELRQMLLNPRPGRMTSTAPATLDGPLPADGGRRAGISILRVPRRRD